MNASNLSVSLFSVAADAVILARRTLSRAGASSEQTGDLGTVCADLDRIADVLSLRGKAEHEQYMRDNRKPFVLPNSRRKVIRNLYSELPTVTLSEVKNWCLAHSLTPPENLTEWKSAVMVQAEREGIVSAAPVVPTQPVISSAAATVNVKEESIDAITPEEREAMADDVQESKDARVRADDVGEGLTGLKLLHARKKECRERKLATTGTTVDLLNRLRADDERRTERAKGVISKSASVIEVKTTKPTTQEASKPTVSKPVVTTPSQPVPPTQGIEWASVKTQNGKTKYTLSYDGKPVGHAIAELDGQRFYYTLHVNGQLKEICKANEGEEIRATWQRMQIRLVTLCGLDNGAKPAAVESKPVEKKQEASKPETVKPTAQPIKTKVGSKRMPFDGYTLAELNDLLAVKHNRESIHALAKKEGIDREDVKEAAKAIGAGIKAAITRLEMASKASEQEEEYSLSEDDVIETQPVKKAGEKKAGDHHHKSEKADPRTLRDGSNDKARAKTINLSLEQYRVLLALVQHECPMTYKEIQSATVCDTVPEGYYKNLTVCLRSDKPGSLCDMGLAQEGRTEDDTMTYEATAKGKARIKAAIGK